MTQEEFVHALIKRHSDDQSDLVVEAIIPLILKYEWSREEYTEIARVMTETVCKAVNRTADLMSEVNAEILRNHGKD
jgi:hypothetical protein